jgi:hypothetical protein
MMLALVRIFSAILLINIGLCCFNVAAQSSVKLLNSQGDEVAKSVLNDARLKSLRQDLHPGIYLKDGQVVRKDQKATTLVTDPASMFSVKELGSQTRLIEMVTVTIDDIADLGNDIDASSLSEFENLKYLQVRSSVPTTTEHLQTMVKNMGGNYLLLLNVDPVN